MSYIQRKTDLLRSERESEPQMLRKANLQSNQRRQRKISLDSGQERVSVGTSSGDVASQIHGGQQAKIVPTQN